MSKRVRVTMGQAAWSRAWPRGVVVVVALLLLLARAAGASDAAVRLAHELVSARSFKVRVQAAALLARTRDPRAVPALAHAAAHDPEPIVRALAVRLLGGNPGGASDGAVAHAALVEARGDSSAEVRRQALAALARLEQTLAAAQNARHGPPVIGVRAMGDRTGRASRALRDHMRGVVLAALQQARGVRVVEPPDGSVGFVVDGTISKLELGNAGAEVETTCAVELVISRPPRGILMVASGEATVQRSHAHAHPDQRARMEEEALTHAVASAHENLEKFFAQATY